jgi:hypothetical protein
MDLRSGVKLYDNDWFVRLGLSEERLADTLCALNVTYAISQSRFLPMQDSAVKSHVSAAERERYTRLDDLALRHALRERGIAYVAVLNICFDPAYGAAHPEDAAVDQWGRPLAQVDWYFGIPPDRDRNLAEKGALLRCAIEELDPDGIHLGFIRWPGFWETWLPGDQRSDKPEYCYAPQTLRRFAAFAGVDFDCDHPVAAAAQIARDHRAAWTRFKCEATAAAIGELRSAVRTVRPNTPISINTLPFFSDDFDQAVTEVYGQDVARLATVVDVFEVMAYHQIVARDSAWPAAIASDIKARSGQTTVCTVQAEALYLDGMHAGKGRKSALGSSEFSAVLDAIEPTSVDGLCLFTFTQLLDRAETPDGRAMLDRLRRFRR